MGVDGFRFDLAPVLGRGADGEFSHDAAFFQMLRDEKALAGIALIAEPWDGGSRGYRVGGFPAPRQEWNDRLRDAARGFWLGKPGPHGVITRRELAARLMASPELYEGRSRPPTSGVNFIAVKLARSAAAGDRHRRSRRRGADAARRRLAAGAEPRQHAAAAASRGARWRGLARRAGHRAGSPSQATAALPARSLRLLRRLPTS
jgi:glycogen operon protein